MTDAPVFPPSSQASDHDPATTASRVPSGSSTAPLSGREMQEFRASLVALRLKCLWSTTYDIADPQDRIRAAAAAVTFAVSGPSRQSHGNCDPNLSCDVDALAFAYLHNARLRCLSIARRHADPDAAANAFHAFVFDGVRAVDDGR